MPAKSLRFLCANCDIFSLVADEYEQGGDEEAEPVEGDNVDDREDDEDEEDEGFPNFRAFYFGAFATFLMIFFTVEVVDSLVVWKTEIGVVHSCSSAFGVFLFN